MVDYDVIVVGGGPIGLATAYESAKAGRKVVVLEQFSFFNYAGSSGDLVRMFRTMYTEDYLADLALEARDAWRGLERDSAEQLILMTGLLNFGDPDAPPGVEGSLLGPIANLERHKMPYRRLTTKEIMNEYPFKDLPANYEGVYQDLNGCINVPLTVRTLHRLFLQYGGDAIQYAQVKTVVPLNQDTVLVTYVNTQDNTTHTLSAKKAAITGGAYVNHILRPSFKFELDLAIWEMVYSYFSVNSGPNGTLFPCMWFQFAQEEHGKISDLLYGFPAVPWGPPNMVRVAVDSAVRIISDPNQRTVSPSHELLQHTSDWIKVHLKGVDPVPHFTGACLQTNVVDNNFVLDFIPSTHNNIVLFTAGWAMKFVPLIGKILTDLMLQGTTKHDISHFKINRVGIIKEPVVHRAPRGSMHFLGGKFAPPVASNRSNAHRIFSFSRQGSSMPAPVTRVGKAHADIDLAKKRTNPKKIAQTKRAAVVNLMLRATSIPPHAPITTSIPVTPSPDTPPNLFHKTLSAHKIIKQKYKETLQDIISSIPILSDLPVLSVGIVGGGVTGLYAAMILKDLGIDFTILEASNKRWGGRVYTHHFKELSQHGYTGINGYVDLGAMRFPKIKSMKRTFDLFDLVGLDDKHREKYHLKHANNLLFYNGVRMTKEEYEKAMETDKDPLHFSEKNGGGVPDSFVEIGVDEILEGAFGPILESLNADFNAGFQELMKTDGMSTRAYLSEYLSQDKNINAEDIVNVVNWLETLGTSSGLYDEAFSETIIDTLDFQTKDPEGKDIEWYCLTGGCETLIHHMLKRLDGDKLYKGKVVTKIAPCTSGSGITLTVRDTEKEKKGEIAEQNFSHVISTVPLSILRQIDTDECHLGYHKRTAIRIMHYDHSTKVVLVFKTRWWQKLEKPIFGGQSSTDLFVRTVVYPSYGIHEENAPGVLMVSYSWAQDASRMASICLREDVAELCLTNLADLHNIPITRLKEEYLGLVKHVDWHREPYLDGAFALYGPGQFISCFEGAITPEVHGNLHFAGEALSVHHAWIIGSLNSAYRTVHEILVKENLKDKIDLLKKNWGTIDLVEYGGVDLDKFVQ